MPRRHFTVRDRTRNLITQTKETNNDGYDEQ
jgi:hypothetical protein